MAYTRKHESSERFFGISWILPKAYLLKKDVFSWNTKIDAAFQELKSALAKAPVSALPDFAKPFIIECDASGTKIGAVLMQNQHPIAFLGKALQGRSVHWSTYERDACLVLVIQKWLHYLLGRSFIIQTGHASLKYL